MDLDALLDALAARVAQKLASPAPPPAQPLGEWVSIEAYAAHVGKSPGAVRKWVARAPCELKAKYGREWRIQRLAFDAWVRRGGPFGKATEDEGEGILDH